MAIRGGSRVNTSYTSRAGADKSLTILLTRLFTFPLPRHREDTAPLLGTGNISLKDEPKPEPDEEEGPVKNYGAVAVDVPPELKQKLFESEATAAILKTHPSFLKPHMPRQNPCLWIFHLLQGVAVVSALCLLITQAIPIALAVATSYPDEMNFLGLALKVYISLFCILFVLVEANVNFPFIRTSPLLQTFLSRGFIYSFLGLICVEEAYSERVKDLVSHGKDAFHVGWLAIFMQISSWFMLGVGTMYMLLGVFCLKGLRDRMHQREHDNWKKYREDLRAWKEIHG